MQEHLLGIFSSPGCNGFVNDVSITFIDKTDSSDPLKWEDYKRRTLKTMAPFGLSIEDSIWSVIMVINDYVVINIYLAFRSQFYFGLFYYLMTAAFGWWIIYLAFRSRYCFGLFYYFKDCSLWMMDIFIHYFYCYCTAWNEGFSF